MRDAGSAKSISRPLRTPSVTVNFGGAARSALFRAASACATAGCMRSWIASISGLFAIDFSVTCGTVL